MCSKKPYPNRYAAEHALNAIQARSRSCGKKPPTGSYWCPCCRQWHLTSKSKSRPAPWQRL